MENGGNYKTDLIPEDLPEEENPVTRIRAVYEPLGYEVYPISAATGEGVKELLYHISSVLASMPHEVRVFEAEFDPATDLELGEDSFTVTYDEKRQEYVVEGPKVEKMLGFTNLETEKGLAFLQRFIEDSGITARLKELGVQEGDIVRLYGHTFEYYD